MSGLTMINIFGAICIILIVLFGDKMREFDV